MYKNYLRSSANESRQLRSEMKVTSSSCLQAMAKCVMKCACIVLSVALSSQIETSPHVYMISNRSFIVYHDSCKQT